jgi:glycosyltransferase involved in cell wall biosynthesis
MMKISVVIPCRNDAVALASALARLANFAGEVVVADASDDDRSAAVTQAAGRVYLACAVRGRGPQMNAGAARATGEVLCFSHADSELTVAHLEAVATYLQGDARRAAGAFFKDTRHHYPAWAWADGLVRWWMRHWGLVYGDQSVFLRAAHFAALGGFADVPIMEDVVMSPHLRRSPGFALLDPPLRTSMRRFLKRGRWWTRWQNIGLVWLFWCGVSPQRIYGWYYR